MSDVQNQEPPPAGQQGEATDKDGFGAAFAERSNDPGKQASETQADGADKEPSNKEPAEPQAGSTETPADAAASDAPADPPAKADPWEGLTPEQKSYFERLQASERSNRGRVGALTKKLHSTTAPRATDQPAAPAGDKAPQQDREAEQGTKTEGTTEGEGADKASDLDKRLQAAVDEYGDVIGPVAELLKDVRAEIAGIKATVSAVEVENDAQQLTAAYAALEQVHPDYQALAADDNFAAWLGDQPKPVVDLANSFDPREVSLVLTLFKTERSAATAKQPGGEGEPGKEGSTATDAKRQRQLEGSRQVPGKGQPAAAGTPKDFSSAFHARAQATAADSR